MIFGAFVAINAATAFAQAFQEAVAEKEAFEEYVRQLPPDEAAAARAERARKQRAVERHRRALEIAREGRPLNFWGHR
jgi:hypothetical protein